MRRRSLLRAVGLGLASALAGCRRGDSEAGTDSERTPTETQGPSESPTAAPPRVGDVDLPVPRSEFRNPLPRDYIPAITDPAFGTDWRGLEAHGGTPTLPGEVPVIGVDHEDRARAYPLRVLNHHEIVNDDFGGPIAVTYCVLCGSAIVFERVVDGEPTQFGVSGKLWRSDLVMYDRLTESLWSQLMATAIRGPQTGAQLTLRPSTLTTWAEWRATYPETRVLLPPPRSTTTTTYDRSFDYFSEAYNYRNESQLIGRDTHDGDLHPKSLVIGVTADGTARAYPFHVLSEEDVVNDVVGTRPVVVAGSPDDTLVAYDRRIDGDQLRFEAADEQLLVAGGSAWQRTTGTAVSGPYQGRQLRRANDKPPLFWQGWSAFHPDTDVYE
jgi:hypothetical protein